MLMKNDIPPIAEESANRPVGLRERGKQKRRQSIKEAARAIFLERGYESATTREIAERAEVSLGTLFAYAPTKPELLVMILNDDLDEMSARTVQDWSEDKPLLDMLLDFSMARYAYWARQPQLARHAMSEITSFMLGRPDPGPEATRFRDRVPLLLTALTGAIERKQDGGTIGSVAPASLIADFLWGIYNHEVQMWLIDTNPNVRKGIARLRELFLIALGGLQLEPKELGQDGTSSTDGSDAPARSKSAHKSVGRGK